MSNQYDLTQYLLSSIPGAHLVADNRQILCRCPICMDSANLSSAHFYIGPMKDSGKPLQYDCKKCGSQGMFTSKTLQLFGIYDLELATMINEYNSQVTNGKEWYNNTALEGTIHNIKNSNISMDAISERKLAYINSRIGCNLDYQDLIDNKIVLNLIDLLSSNYVKSLTRAQSIVEQLNHYFIGFISFDNGYVNMRRLCKEGKVYKTIDKRYINYNIFNTIDNSMRFYVIPNKIDLLDPNPIDIWITEGPFDALSVKYNVRPNKRSIYISAGGKGYLVVVKFVLQYLGLMNIRLHLCPDGDVDDRAMYNIRNFIWPFNLDISIHRNMFPEEKDFGVPKEKIKESEIVINHRG